MTSRLALLALLVTAPSVRAQTMIDAAAAGAIQGSLQGASTPGYVRTLQRSRQLLDGASGGGASSSQGAATATGGSGAVPLQPGAGAGPPGVASFRVNGRVIGMCASGLPCLNQIRRAMGLY